MSFNGLSPIPIYQTTWVMLIAMQYLTTSLMIRGLSTVQTL